MTANSTLCPKVQNRGSLLDNIWRVHHHTQNISDLWVQPHTKDIDTLWINNNEIHGWQMAKYMAEVQMIELKFQVLFRAQCIQLCIWLRGHCTYKVSAGDCLPSTPASKRFHPSSIWQHHTSCIHAQTIAVTKLQTRKPRQSIRKQMMPIIIKRDQAGVYAMWSLCISYSQPHASNDVLMVLSLSFLILVSIHPFAILPLFFFLVSR